MQLLYKKYNIIVHMKPYTTIIKYDKKLTLNYKKKTKKNV